MTSRGRSFVFIRNAANMSARRTCPEVWLYFTREDDAIATCKLAKCRWHRRGEIPPTCSIQLLCSNVKFLTAYVTTLAIAAAEIMSALHPIKVGWTPPNSVSAIYGVNLLSHWIMFLNPTMRTVCLLCEVCAYCISYVQRLWYKES